MDHNVKKIMDMTVAQRFDELRLMGEFNDAKVILRLSDEWEFQAKVSAILSLKVRADAHHRRGSIDFVKSCLIKIAHISDGAFNCLNKEGHGLRIIVKDDHPDLNRRRIEVPWWYFDSLGDDILEVIEIYRSKSSMVSDQISKMSTPIKMTSDGLLQGQSNDWQMGELFNYFPMNLNKTRVNSLLVNAKRENVVRSAIKSVIRHSIKSKVVLGKDEIVVTMGSCFASELYVSLQKQGIRAESLRIEESINTTHANLLLLKSVARGVLEPDLQDLFDGDDMTQRLAFLRQLIGRAKVVVVTVGVSPLVVDKKSGQTIYRKSLKDAFARGDVEMRFSSVLENADNIKHIVALLKSMSPQVEVFVTLSPVPLIGVPSGLSVLERDVVSKSTIRLAIEEAAKTASFTYWPSFEVVKWLAPHLDPNKNFQAFGDPDNNSRHVSRWLIDEITKSFIDNVIEPVKHD